MNIFKLWKGFQRSAVEDRQRKEGFSYAAGKILANHRSAEAEITHLENTAQFARDVADHTAFDEGIEDAIAAWRELMRGV